MSTSCAVGLLPLGHTPGWCEDHTGQLGGEPVRPTRRLTAVVALGAALLLAGCGLDDDEGELRVYANGVEVHQEGAPAGQRPGASPRAPAPLPFRPAPPPSSLDPDDLRGFGYPLEGGCLPGFDGLLPNAPRPYRNGVNEGVDWYPGSGCAAVEPGTPVYAMYDGVVVRADHDYLDLTLAELQVLEGRIAAAGYADPDALDQYRGRQVWIDHGNGIVTRYANLRAVSQEIFVGLGVKQSELVGFAGESGTPESVTDPGTQLHLHAEVRVGDSYLGAGLSAEEVRALYERLFSPAAEAATVG